MKFEKVKHVAMALFVSSALAAAQTPTTPKQDEKAKPVPAASPIVLSKVKAEVVIPVQGVTAENAAKVESTLEGLKVSLYDCSGCKARFEKAGTCPACKSNLQMQGAPLLETVTVSPEKSQVTIQTHEGMQLRLSEIERALGANSVKIDTAKMTIPGNAVLIVAGVGNAEQAKAIQKALEDSKLFSKVNVTPATDGTGLVEVTAGTAASSRVKVEETITKVAPAHKVQDVIWNCWHIEKA